MTAGDRHAPWAYLTATLAWTWVLWGLAAAVPGGWDRPLVLVAFVLGGLGPLLVAGALVTLGRAEEPPAAFWRRALDPRRVSPRWWAIVAALAVGPPLVARLLTAEPGAPLLAPGPAAFLIVGALAGAAEEPGWRGYAQHALQRRMPVLAASLVVGIAWAAWHLPLFLMEGTYQHGLGVLTQEFWLFHLGILVATVLYGWLYNAVAGATVAVVGLHALANVANEVLPEAGSGAVGLVIQAMVVVGVLLVAWRWLVRPRQAESPGR